MKVRSKQKDEDLLCQESLNFLSKRITHYFEKNFPDSKTWFPDDLTSENIEDSEGPINIVLYGNYLRDLIESEYWPGSSFKIWVLSHQVKKHLSDFLQLAEGMIGVIPRNQLLDLQKSSKPNFGTELIYGGRLSRQKNLLDLLFTSKFLENLTEGNSRLSLFGNFDNEYHHNLGRFVFNKNFEEVFKDYAKALEFKHPIELKHNLNSEQWPREVSSSDSFISLSTYYMEDFGVSVAQMLEGQVPCYLSSWGGYLDYDSDFIKFLPTNLIGTHANSLGLRLAKAERLARLITDKEFAIRSKNESTVSPQVLLKSDLLILREKLFKSLGKELVQIPRDKFAAFSDSQAGKLLNKDLEHSFCADEKASTCFFICRQLGHESKEENSQIYGMAKNLLEEDHKKKLISLDSLSALEKSNTKILIEAKEVFITKKALDSSANLVNFLSEMGIMLSVLEDETRLPFGLGSTDGKV